MRYCLIVNPVAGGGRSLAVLEKAKQRFQAAGVDYAVRLTTSPGEAVFLAAQASSEAYDAVVSVGGDGTLCEVAHGLAGSDCTLGILPGGRGNDYCRCVDIPEKDTDRAIQILLDGHRRAVDIMRVNDLVGLNVSSVGFDEEVVRNSRRFAWFKGLSYVVSVFYTILHYHSLPLRIQVDDGLYEQPTFLVAAGCGTHYGGGINVLPEADPSDGLMDVCVIDPVTRGQVVRLLPKFMKGRHKGFPFVHMTRARHVVVESDRPFHVNMDGELLDNLRRVDMELVAHGLQVLTPV
jgi:diacylglycerol kinase (ATP)